jgi:hypothetical protein
MLKNLIGKQLRFLLLVLMFAGSMWFMRAAEAQVAPIPTPTFEVASTPSMLEKIGMRLGSIFFQNIGRSVINDFAYDAATYIGSGGKGQQALFVKEKWGNFWKNVGDKAAGDFVETLAKTIISDVASSQRDKAGPARCEAAYTSCSEAAAGDPAKLQVCTERRDKCLGSIKTEEQLEAKCDADVQTCKDACSGTYSDGAEADKCFQTCEITYNYCWSKVAAKEA